MENDKYKPEGAVNDEVDSILAEILNKDGTFNDGFNSLYSRYLSADEKREEPVMPVSGLSDRSDDIYAGARVSYEDPSVRPHRNRDADEIIGEKMPGSMRRVYSEAVYEAQRPNYTSRGTVNYPSMGVGSSEERVVYDAEWEEKARREADRLERVRAERGSRDYGEGVRSDFIAGGRSTRPPRKDVPRGANPDFIDPLSDDDDRYTTEYYAGTERRRQNTGDDFFREGPTVSQRNNAPDGRTATPERSAPARRDYYPASPNRDWMQVEDKSLRNPNKKKKTETALGSFGSEETEQRRGTPEPPGFDGENYHRRTVRRLPTQSEIEKMSLDREGDNIRETVSEIVEKYNRREEEERIRAIHEEELAKAREERLKDEEIRRRKELESIRATLPADALSASGDVLTGDFDDFEELPLVPETEETADGEYSEPLNSPADAEPSAEEKPSVPGAVTDAEPGSKKEPGETEADGLPEDGGYTEIQIPSAEREEPSGLKEPIDPDAGAVHFSDYTRRGDISLDAEDDPDVFFEEDIVGGFGGGQENNAEEADNEYREISLEPAAEETAEDAAAAEPENGLFDGTESFETDALELPESGFLGAFLENDGEYEFAAQADIEIDITGEQE